MNKIILALLVSVALSGCSSTTVNDVLMWKPSGPGYVPEGLFGGYSDEHIRDNIYSVEFIGNGYSKIDDVRRYIYLRCAELTLEKGKKFYAIVDYDVGINEGHYVSSIGYYYHVEKTSSPSGKFIIQLYDTREGALDAGHRKGLIYDAMEEARSLRSELELD